MSIAIIDKESNAVIAYCEADDPLLESFKHSPKVELKPAIRCPECGGKGIRIMKEDEKSLYHKQQAYLRMANCCSTCKSWGKMSVTMGACDRFTIPDRMTEDRNICILYEPKC